MDINTLIVVLIPSILSSAIALIHIFLSYKRMKEPPKDEIWETTTKLICTNQQQFNQAEDFAELYVQLKEFKDSGHQLSEDSSLAILRRAKKSQVDEQILE